MSEVKENPVVITTTQDTNVNIHEQKLASYLNSFIETKQSFPRVKCCGSSKGLYCECQKLLIPRNEWPIPIQEGTLNLPFDLDIILSDRKKSASGFHAIVLLKASHDSREGRVKGRQEEDIRQQQEQQQQEQQQQQQEQNLAIDNDNSIQTRCNTRLIDTNEGEEVPMYNQYEERGISNSETYLLFPSKSSIPLSTVAARIKKLIVLDCKWTKTTTQHLPQLQNVQHVHLDGSYVPLESYYWRWHNAGKGMCSTLEAIYFSALQVSKQKNYSDNEIHNLIHLMWLFAIQRSATIKTAKREGKPDPFSVEGKERQRSLRRTIKGSEKHIRDIEKGKELKKIHREEKATT
jgi:hypothetical protein